MTELWTTIVEYPNYAISSLGNVKSFVTGKLLSSKTNKHPYASVCLGRAFKGNNTRRYVHRLVATHFVKNPNNFTVVNHLDGNKRNNVSSNLEWCTTNDNNQHSWRIGTSKQVPKKLSKSWVNLIRDLYVDRQFSQQDLGFLFGVGQSTIYEIISRKIWKEVA